MADDEKNFTAEEREAMKAAAADKRKARSRAKKSPEEARAEGLADLREAIGKLPDAKKLSEVIANPPKPKASAGRIKKGAA